MIKLIKETSPDNKPYTSVDRVEFIIDEDSSLPQLLEAMQEFLQAIGYGLKGELQIVEEDADDEL